MFKFLALQYPHPIYTIIIIILIIIKSNPIKKDTEVAIESVCIDRMSVLSELNLERNVRDFFFQGQSKLSIIMMYP